MPVVVNGMRCPIIGRISMDMMAIDVTNVDQPQVGDAVELWGENLAVEELVPYTHNISYHIITGMQHRVKFTWVE
jgi:alanine racemase